jgi:uncharacterized protein with von Willebrand factor type A (vWA) domain
VIDSLSGFVAELREIGIPVSMVEAIDAAVAIEHTDLSEAENLRATLGATLVKNSRHYAAFDAAFDVFFGLRFASPSPSDADREGTGGASAGGSSGGAGDGSDEIGDAILRALLAGDGDALRRLVAEAIDMYAGMQPGRPVGGRYYAYRVLRRLDSDQLMVRLLTALGATQTESELEDRTARANAEELVDQMRNEIEREITSRLVADRGAARVAAARRMPLIEDTNLMHATRAEIEEVERAIAPLARKLATRLSQQRRQGAKGRLDVRRTIRRSLSHGGVLLEPQFKKPRKSKPEFVVICDVSGSMATFARFTMQLAYAISSELSKVRVFAFIDGLDEVTEYFGPGVDFSEALMSMTSEADLVRSDGHSDYGRSFRDMLENYAEAVTSKSTVIVTGDARNNYRDPGTEYLDRMAERSRALFWLNPEPRRFWDTGDSVMSRYAQACDDIDQVRTLRQLESFVERAALPADRRPRLVS